MSNESHPSPTGSSSSSLFGGGGSNTAGVSGTSPHPSPSKLTWAQVLNSNPNTSSNTSTSTTSTTTVIANNAATTSTTTGNNAYNNKSGGGGGSVSNTSSSSSPSSQQPTTMTSTTGGGGGGGTAQIAGASSVVSTTRSISPSQVTPSNSGAFNIPGSRTGVMQNMYDQQQQQSQMNWSLNFNQTSSSWMVDDDTQRRSNLVGASSQQSVDSNRNTPGGGDGFDRLESSSPTSDWGKPVNTNNSAANGWSNFQQQQQTVNNPSRSNPVGSNNTPSNQWPEMNNFYAPSSSNNTPFNLPQNNNDNMNNNNQSATWQDPSLSGNNNDAMGLTLGGINSSVINKHKSSSSSSMAASLTGALKSAIAMGGANVDLSGNPDPLAGYVPQPKLVEQLGWDEPDIKVTKRMNFDDGTSIWGDPMESVSVPVKKWTNGTKAALSNSTNIILQQPAVVQKNTNTNVPASNQTSNSQMVLNEETWPKQQSPTISQQTVSQWTDATPTVDQAATSSANPAANYRTQQSLPANWNSQIQPSSHHGPDDWFRDGVVDTSDWGLQGPQNKVPFDPYEGQVDTSGWGVQMQGGAGANMGGSLSMPPMNRNRFMSDYDPNENPHDPHGMHRMASYDSQGMGDLYRQGSDLKNPIIGIGSLLPASANNPSHHMLPPNQLPFAPRPGPIYQPNNMIRPMAPNAIPTPSGAIMGTGSLISPKLSTTSPVPNQAPYVPLAAKQPNMPAQTPQTPTSQQPQQPGGGGPVNNGAVHAQIMQQFRLAVQAGLISQDLLNTKLPPYMLQLLQKLFELQQKFQSLSIQLADFTKHKQRFPITFFQTEYERLSKAISQKKQEMLLVQKQIQDAHAKLVQQQSGAPTPTPSQMMTNGPVAQNQTTAPPGVSSTQAQDQLAERMQHSLNVDQSRLHQWTKQQTSTRGGQSSSSMFGPPGLTQKDWQASGNTSNENWENTQSNESNNTNQADPHAHNSQAASSSSTFGDALSEFVDDADGPPPFIPGQLWNWKASLPNAEDDPHVTPSSLTMGPKGPSSSMNNLNVGGAESAFSNPQLLHQMHRQQANRSQWQQALHDQQGFQPSMSDWGKPHQFRGTSKLPPSLNHPPPPPHASFGGYRPYM